MRHNKQRRLLCESLERRQLFSVDLDFGARDFHSHASNERYELSREVHHDRQSTQLFSGSNSGSFRGDRDNLPAAPNLLHRSLEPLSFTAVQPANVPQINNVSQPPLGTSSPIRNQTQMAQNVDDVGAFGSSSASKQVSSLQELTGNKPKLEDPFASSTTGKYQPVIVIIGIAFSPVANSTSSISINSLLNSSSNVTNVDTTGNWLTNVLRSNNTDASTIKPKFVPALDNNLSTVQSAFPSVSLEVSNRVTELLTVRSLSTSRVQLFVLGPEDVRSESVQLPAIDTVALIDQELADLLQIESIALDEVHLLDDSVSKRWQLSTDTLHQLRSLSTPSTDLRTSGTIADAVSESWFTGPTGIIEIAYRQTPIVPDSRSTDLAADSYELHSQLGLFRLLVVLGDGVVRSESEISEATQHPAMPTLSAIESDTWPIDLSKVDSTTEPADVPRKSSILLTSLLAVFTSKAIWQRRDRVQKVAQRNYSVERLSDKSRSD